MLSTLTHSGTNDVNYFSVPCEGRNQKPCLCHISRDKLRTCNDVMEASSSGPSPLSYRVHGGLCAGSPSAAFGGPRPDHRGRACGGARAGGGGEPAPRCALGRGSQMCTGPRLGSDSARRCTGILSQSGISIGSAHQTNHTSHPPSRFHSALVSHLTHKHCSHTHFTRLQCFSFSPSSLDLQPCGQL